MASKARPASGELRARRAAAGLTQQKLAERASVSIASIALYEGGYSPAHSTVLGRLFAVLDDLNDERPPRRGAGRDAVRSHTEETEQANIDRLIHTFNAEAIEGGASATDAPSPPPSATGSGRKGP